MGGGGAGRQEIVRSVRMGVVVSIAPLSFKATVELDHRAKQNRQQLNLWVTPTMKSRHRPL